MTKRQEQAQRTKRAIVTSALELFQKRGFDAVSVAEITQNAGVAKGSFYTYFGTKSDIIVEEFWGIDSFYRKNTEDALSPNVSPQAKLIRFTRAQMLYIRDVVGNANLKILYANQTIQQGADKVIIDRSRYWHTYIRDTIAEGQKGRLFRTDLTADELAVLFNRSIRSIFLDWCISDASFDLEEEGVRYVRIWLLPALLIDADETCAV